MSLHVIGVCWRMLDINDFSKKQIVCFFPAKGEKISYKNDNMVITDKDGCIKYQHTCYRIFMLIVIGDVSLTTGIIKRAAKFGFSICFMSYGFRIYSVINAGMQGNTLLHKKQYLYNETGLAQTIIKNKIQNQKQLLLRIRNKSEFTKEGIELLENYITQLSFTELTREKILGYEGNASRVYFARIFDNVNWKGRKPRIKFDYVNSLLDIGYTLLFNFIDSILQVFGFDVYCGVLHTCFYMRKSLVCDIVEPFRPIIDWRVRIGINLKQFSKEDFVKINNQWQLNYSKSSVYANIFMTDLLNNKESIFLYIRSYYRAFMKGLDCYKFPNFNIKDGLVIMPEEEV